MTTLEVVYTWPGGREEIRYRRSPHDSDDANKLKSEVEVLKANHGEECPYSWRIIGDETPREPCESDLIDGDDYDQYYGTT